MVDERDKRRAQDKREDDPRSIIKSELNRETYARHECSK